MPTAAHGTATRILDIAEQLVQVHGFNGFSYADVAAQLEIRKASIHHHFPAKTDLGARLIERYHERFAHALAAIDEAGADARTMVERYVRLYADVLRNNRMCLCGMMAAEISALPRALRDAVHRFFDQNETWLARVLERARRAGALAFIGTARAQARLIISALEGAMLVARSYGDVARFESASAALLANLGLPSRRRPRSRSR